MKKLKLMMSLVQLKFKAIALIEMKKVDLWNDGRVFNKVISHHATLGISISFMVQISLFHIKMAS